MSVTREEVSELVMKLYDRLAEEDYAGCTVEDAVLLVELSHPDAPGDTEVVMEPTSKRVTVQLGMFEFAFRSLAGAIDVEEE